MERKSKNTKKTTTISVVVFEKDIQNASVNYIRRYKRRATADRFRLHSTPCEYLGAILHKTIDIQKLQALIVDLKQEKSISAHNFIKKIGLCFPQEVEREKRTKTFYNSKYQLIELCGVDILLRVSDHNMNSENITDNIEEAYSIVIKEKDKRQPNIFKENENITATEYVYLEQNTDNERYCKIIQGIINIIDMQEYIDLANADFINHSPNTENLGEMKEIDINSLFDSLHKKGITKLSDHEKSHETEKQPAPKTPELDWYLHIKYALLNGESFKGVNLERYAKEHGYIFDSQNTLLQETELGIVKTARFIALKDESPRVTFDKLIDIYDRQPTIKPTDTASKVLQQYSTPCPLAWLLSAFVARKRVGNFLEPSAGNGMLTIANKAEKFIVNDLDNVRYRNLLESNYQLVYNIDTSNEKNIEKILNRNTFNKLLFDGVITNPPFATLKEKYERNGWTIESLDHKMAILALDAMKDDGKAAIIVGGKMFNNYFKPQGTKQVIFGRWKMFLGYLYAQYNVIDVIYMNGDNIYRKQGTTYPIVAILINGRHKYDETIRPRYTYDEAYDKPLDTFEQVFARILPHIQNSSESTESSDRERRLRLAIAKAKAIKIKLELNKY